MQFLLKLFFIFVVAPFALQAAVIEHSRSPIEEAFRWKGTNESDPLDAKALSWYFHHNLGIEIDPTVTPWCAAFVDAVLISTKRKKLGTLWAKDFLNYGLSVEEPKRGDLVIVKRGDVNGHVGFFVRRIKDKNGKIWIGILGGNTGKEGSGSVAITYVEPNKVLGYRRPLVEYLHVGQNNG